jgi:protein ImuB
MKRVLALWLPNWAVQRLLRSRPELAGHPLVLEAPSQRGPCVAACSREAYEAGVAIGMPIAEAIALLTHNPTLTPSPLIEPLDPLADRQALVQLAQWCHRYTPTAGVEDGEAPQTLLLDATNLTPLYGGEEEFVRQVMQGVRRLGFERRAALASTISAAWALAHYSREGEAPAEPTIKATGSAGGPSEAWIVPQAPSTGRAGGFHETETAIAPLPVAALRLSDELLETLRNLGVERIADLLVLPREQLRSRFGPELLARLDQALGTAREVFAAVPPPEEFIVEQLFEFPISDREALHHVIESLLGRLAWMLKARCAGALRVACRFEGEGALATELEVGLFQPTANPRHLLEILELELERLRLRAPATAVSLHVLRHAPLEPRQGVLFDDQRNLESSLPLAALVDRLAGRLGRQAVVRCRLQREVQPELAYAEEPLVGDVRAGISNGHKQSATRRKRTSQNPSPNLSSRGRGTLMLAPLDRPLYLLRRPAPLETSSIIPDGPPIQFRRGGRRHVVARHWGPERLETGWWRGQSAWRDYYRVETTEGHRYWLFRRRRDGKWFLHGIFG